MTATETRIFAALSDETRRRVLSMVASASDGATATSLAATLPVTRQAVARHLSILEDAGLVVGQRRGRERVFVVNPRPLELAARYLVRLGAIWDQRLAGLREMVESDQPEAERDAAT
jgi:DNA-binding transcriptional ArsR family regulator